MLAVCLSVCLPARITNLHMWGTHELMSHRCCATTVTNLLDVCLSVCLWANFVFVCVSMSAAAELEHMRDSRTDVFQVPCNDWYKQCRCLFVFLWVRLTKLYIWETHELTHVRDSRTDVLQVLCNDWNKHVRMSVCLSVYERDSRTNTHEKLTNSCLV